jgi:hypothetical protein
VLIRVTTPEHITNGVRVQREVTVALQKESVRMTSPGNIANGVRIQRGVTFALKNSVD